MAAQKIIDGGDDLLGGGQFHAACHTSALADIASADFSVGCNSGQPPSSVNADAVETDDPNSLYSQLMAVKPAGLSPHAWSVRARVSRQVFADIRRRGSANHGTILKLLEAIGLSLADFEAGKRQEDKDLPSAAAQAPRLAFQAGDRPRDVPVVGTAECGDIDFPVDGSMVAVEAMTLDVDDVVDHVRRPASLDNRRDVYAIYFRGDSMAPRYEPGELAYVDPRRAPSAMSYVILQLRAPDGNGGERIVRVLAKRLIRKTAAFYELEQFNPPAVFRVAVADVAHCHRIIPWEEMVAF